MNKIRLPLFIAINMVIVIAFFVAKTYLYGFNFFFAVLVEVILLEISLCYYAENIHGVTTVNGCTYVKLPGKK